MNSSGQTLQASGSRFVAFPTERIGIALLIMGLLLLQCLSLLGLTSSPLFTLSEMALDRGGGKVNLTNFLAMCGLVYIVTLRKADGLLQVVVILLVMWLLAWLFWLPPSQKPMELLGFGARLLGAVALVHTAWMSWQHRHAAHRSLAPQLLGTFLLLLMMLITVGPLIYLTAALQPATHDIELYLLDAAYGFLPSQLVAAYAAAHPAVYEALEFAYLALSAVMTLFIGVQLRRQTPAPINAFYCIVLCAAAVMVAYNVFPICGPKYVFGPDFPNQMPELSQLPMSMTLVPPAPRNGMPSMHFTWALVLWMLSLHEARPLRWILAVFALLTMAATLALGEHYLVDLVVAVPTLLAVMAVASTHLPWQGLRTKALAFGLGFYFVWIVLFLNALQAMATWPGLLWGVSLVSTVVSLFWLRRIHLANAAVDRAGATMCAQPSALEPVNARAGSLPVYGLFFISGLAALLYQVIFSKQLAYVFGSMSTATNTVLATYMAGMAIGAWLGGWLAPRLARPILVYALCEFAIGLYCALSPQVFEVIRAAYLSLAVGQPPDAPGLTLLRVGLGAAGLVVPTILMGLTLPVLARFFEGRIQSLGLSVGRLYAMNTLGAGIGALLAGYALIPALGMHKATLMAVAANFLVAYLSLRLQKSLGSESVMTAEVTTLQSGLVSAAQRRLGWAALLLLSVGGFVTLALEVDFVHLLAVAAGNSTYAFSLMLFAFLLGLGGGAETGRRLLALVPPARLLAWLQVALSLAIVFGVRQINQMPDYFANFGEYPVAYGWGARELIRGLMCCIAMVPPAFVIGALYPVAMECIGQAFPTRRVQMLGYASALNTVGNILGVLVAGFILLPAIGALKSVYLLATICLVLSATVVLMVQSVRKVSMLLPIIAAAAVLAVQPQSLNYDLLTTGANVYFRAQPWGEVVDHAESIDGGLTSVHETQLPDGHRVKTLLTNGKFQGNNDSKGEMVAQAGFALAPMLHTPQRNAALVIGYGTGNTSRVLHEAGFKQLDIADLSADIYQMANRHMDNINHRVSEQPNVQAFVTDGRNYLLLTPNRYDLISMEVTSIWFAGAASLYSRDFYRLAKARLNPGGVLQQWVQLHHAAPLDLMYVLGSVRAEFSQVWMYVIGGQGVIVASNDAATVPSLDNLAPSLREAGLTAQSSLMLDPAGIDRLLASKGVAANYFVSNDDNAYLEYSTPKGNVLDGDASMKANLDLLKAYAVPPPP